MKSYKYGILSFVIVLLLMPIGHIVMSFFTTNYSLYNQMIAAGVLGTLGLAIIISGAYSIRELVSTLSGLLGAILMWTGWIEFSFVYFAEKLAVVPIMEGEEIVTRPEYLLMISSGGLAFSIAVIFSMNY